MTRLQFDLIIYLFFYHISSLNSFNFSLYLKERVAFSVHVCVCQGNIVHSSILMFNSPFLVYCIFLNNHCFFFIFFSFLFKLQYINATKVWRNTLPMCSILQKNESCLNNHYSFYVIYFRLGVVIIIYTIHIVDMICNYISMYNNNNNKKPSMIDSATLLKFEFELIVTCQRYSLKNVRRKYKEN